MSSVKAVTPVNDAFSFIGTAGQMREARGVRIFPNAGPHLINGRYREAVAMRLVDPDGAGDVARCPSIVGRPIAAAGVFATDTPYRDAAGILRDPLPVFITTAARWCDGCGVERSSFPACMFGAPDPYPDEVFPVGAPVVVRDGWITPVGGGGASQAWRFNANWGEESTMRFNFSLADLKPGARYRVEFTCLGTDDAPMCDWCDMDETGFGVGMFSREFPPPLTGYTASYRFLDISLPEETDSYVTVAYVKIYKV